jgi:hypothetical protein
MRPELSEILGKIDSGVPEDPSPSPQEVVTLSFPIYRDPEGKPTCCADVEARALCKFFAFSGVNAWACLYPGVNCALRDDDGGISGYLRPPKKCPLWKDRT